VVSGAATFLAVMFGVLTTLAAFYETPEVYPRWIFLLFAAAPAGAAVGWVPALRRRPWLCVLVAVATAAGLLAPALVVGLRNMPPLE
jgi:hypothetical protein